MNISKSTLLMRLCKVLLLFTLAVIITSCVGNTQIPQDHYYRLPAIESSTVYDSPVLAGVVMVDPVMASGILDERSMLYVEDEKPDEVKYYSYRHWMDAPSKMIHQHLISYLEKTRAARTTREVPGGERERSEVKISLLQFERSITKDSVKARVSLKISYKAAQKAKILKTYSAAITAKDVSVYSTVKAFGVGLESIYAEWLADVKEK